MHPWILSNLTIRPAAKTPPAYPFSLHNISTCQITRTSKSQPANSLFRLAFFRPAPWPASPLPSWRGAVYRPHTPYRQTLFEKKMKFFGKKLTKPGFLRFQKISSLSASRLPPGDHNQKHLQEFKEAFHYRTVIAAGAPYRPLWSLIRGQSIPTPRRELYIGGTRPSSHHALVSLLEITRAFRPLATQDHSFRSRQNRLSLRHCAFYTGKKTCDLVWRDLIGPGNAPYFCHICMGQGARGWAGYQTTLFR